MEDNVFRNISVKVDNVTPVEWNEFIRTFDDATIFQTYEYGEQHWGSNHVSHMVLEEGNEVVAASQLWVVKLPFLRCGFAHVSWGPMWKRNRSGIDVQAIRKMLESLKNEYVKKRKLLLRIRCYVVSETTEGYEIDKLLRAQGFTIQKKEAPYRTYRLNMKQDLDVIRSKFKSNWRRDLNKAERESLEIETGTSDVMLEAFSEIYYDMVNRKGFNEYVADIRKYINMQKRLPEDLKMKIFLCKYEGIYVAGIVVPALGDTGMDLLAATTTVCIEKKLHAAHLLQWKVLEWLNNNGFDYYDLRGGIDGDMAGIKHFKSGLSGEEICYLGSYEYSENVVSDLVVRTGETVQRIMKDMIKRFKKKVSP